MSMDWLKDLIDEDINETPDGMAVNDPSGWLLKQIENDEDHCFVLAGENRYTAVAQRKTALAQIEVKLDDEGFVSLSVNAGVYATEQTVIACRMLQMAENATFKHMGYIPAQVGEPITFNVRIRPTDDLDLGSLIGHCVHSVSNQKPAFERIRAGEAPSAVQKELRGNQIRQALLHHRLFG